MRVPNFNFWMTKNVLCQQGKFKPAVHYWVALYYIVYECRCSTFGQFRKYPENKNKRSKKTPFLWLS